MEKKTIFLGDDAPVNLDLLVELLKDTYKVKAAVNGKIALKIAQSPQPPDLILLSLTFIHMMPVFLVLAGMDLRSDEKLFIGWFGPRGLGSIVFAVIVLNEQLPGGDTISMTVVCIIILSIVAHGLSANPLVSVLAALLKARVNP